MSVCAHVSEGSQYLPVASTHTHLRAKFGSSNRALTWCQGDRWQLGLNHASEIRTWLWQLGQLGGWQGSVLPHAHMVQAACDSSNLRNWNQVRRVAMSKMQRLLEAQGLVDKGETCRLFSSARDKLAEVYTRNLRRTGSTLHWLYSAHDHLEMVEVPQGLAVGRDGKVFLTNGLDVPGHRCSCQLHAGFATSDLACAAHGEPLAWGLELSNLPIYPPKERWTGPEDAAPQRGDSVKLAAEGDLVRVGVYAQDRGLGEGGVPVSAPGLKNVADGPQHGSNFVQRQLDSIARLFDDPLSTSSISLHYDGAVHFPVSAATLARRCLPCVRARAHDALCMSLHGCTGAHGCNCPSPCARVVCGVWRR